MCCAEEFSVALRIGNGRMQKKGQEGVGVNQETTRSWEKEGSLESPKGGLCSWRGNQPGWADGTQPQVKEFCLYPVVKGKQLIVFLCAPVCVWKRRQGRFVS